MIRDIINKTIVILFFVISIAIAQKGKGRKPLPKQLPVYLETHVVPIEDSFSCFISYKIRFGNLLFTKEEGRFVAEYSIAFEIYSGEKFVKRAFGNEKVFTNNYNYTLDDNIFSEGIISLSLPEGKYLIKPVIILRHTDVEAKLLPLSVSVDSSNIYKPYFVKNEKPVCKTARYILENLQNGIPFTEESVDMLVPVFSDSVESVSLIQNGNTIIKKKEFEYHLLNPKPNLCDNKIVLNDSGKTSRIKFIRIKSVNTKLYEGYVDVTVKFKERESLSFSVPVLWDNKPKTLSNIDEAIDFLEILGLSDIADDIYDYPDELQYSTLFNYWKKFDDDTTTVFNPAFKEFYSRIDYVQKHFNSVGKHDGIETDRGRTYIIYGAPDKIERKYSEIYNILEVWEYKSINKKIYFSDKTGAGNFKRIK